MALVNSLAEDLQIVRKAGLIFWQEPGLPSVLRLW